MNQIVEKIKNENITIEKDYNNHSVFSYHAGKQLITYPAFQNLNEPASMFTLAHELGHHFQLNSRFAGCINFLSKLANTDKICYLMLLPFVLLIEMDAWIKAFRICKDGKIELDGFLSTAFKAIYSYIHASFYNAFDVLKKVLGLYIGSVFIIRFFMISEQMQLNQPDFMLDIRSAIINSTISHNELIGNIFSYVLMTWLLTIFIRILMNSIIRF